ncbi:MAG: hypothetical protein JW828_15225 [Sedimentisphaerales bacterium]|nr:hypothetical protein [Sedimentisphaerales bacterium]
MSIVNNLSLDEKLALVRSLFERKQVDGQAMDRFASKYPKASKEIIHGLAYHLYIDGHDALLAMLCELELFLQGKIHDISYGWIFEVINHLYNFQLLESLMPEQAQDVIDSITEIESELKDEKPNIPSVLSMLRELKDILEGNAEIPSID